MRGVTRAGRTRSCPAPPSGPRGRCRAGCRERNRSTHSPCRAGDGTEDRARGRRSTRQLSVHSASGLNFQTPRASSHSTAWASARVGDCSRRMPVIQASAPASASLERVHLAPAAAVRGAPRRAVRRRGVHHLDPQPVAVLDLAPDLVGLREQHAGVDREDARRRLDPHEHVDQHRLLLLEGAGHDEARMVALDGEPERLLGAAAHTAHSPSPRITWKGSLRCQSMK